MPWTRLHVSRLNDERKENRAKEYAMARFRGVIDGTAGTATRLGNETTGIMTSVYGWDGAVTVRMSVRNNRDYAIVTLWPGPNQEGGPSITLYEGFIDTPARKLVPMYPDQKGSVLIDPDKADPEWLERMGSPLAKRTNPGG